MKSVADLEAEYRTILKRLYRVKNGDELTGKVDVAFIEKLLSPKCASSTMDPLRFISSSPRRR
jgi:hypothetical protein